MITGLVLAATLACQPATPPPIDWSAPSAGAYTPPRPSTQTGGDFLRSQAAAPVPPAATPSVADLFRERNAREAAAKAAEGQAAPVADGEYHCRRTENGLSCGNDEETMRRAEAEAKARLERLLEPPN